MIYHLKTRSYCLNLRNAAAITAEGYWGALYGMTGILSECDSPALYTTAALSKNGEEIKVLISNFEDKAGYGNVPPAFVSVDFQAAEYEMKEALITDSFGCDTRLTVQDTALELRGYAVALVTLKEKH